MFSRHLYKTGVATEDLKRMRLINETEIEDQLDFEELKDFHDHSKVRHQRKHETKQSFRRRMRKILKEARRAGFILISILRRYHIVFSMHHLLYKS